MKKRLVVLTGAGMSAESGIKTFRDSDGLWENHNVKEVASIEGWYENPQQVIQFYNERRAQLKIVEPNEGHKILKELEQYYEVFIITQNIDNLHERAGSRNIIHLHGELTKVCSEKNKNLICQTTEDIQIGDKAEDGAQLRPFIVWFGEEVPMMEKAMEITQTADIFLVIGTSLQVYPAASLLYYAPETIPIYVIDPKIVEIKNNKKINFIQKGASEGLKEFLNSLNEKTHL